MIGFMLGVLGSIVFWVGYILLGFFVAVFLFRNMAKSCYVFLVKHELVGRHDGSYGGSYCANLFCSTCHKIGDFEESLRYVFVILIFMLIFISWPVLLLVLLLFFSVKFLLGSVLVSLIKCVDEIIPEIKINKKGEEK